ncbi:Arm DNA-binding domain-containing protein [Burkholderia catarinensis]|uniref:Arm DNA-binding domain-containing protein n=1 Tax=Burkholderia catarinensis TaxID=1108140 RepID=UPI001FE3A758|nr:integrase arm-type DNA-binding domain-containing protein [Burkholderia catarinensis]
MSPSGSRLWRYRYRIAGKENLFAIGEYPAVSLQDARVARDDARLLVTSGTASIVERIVHAEHPRRDVRVIAAGTRQRLRAQPTMLACPWVESEVQGWIRDISSPSASAT